MMKNKSTNFQSRKALLLYITAMLILYVLVCMASGNPNWILGVFAQNTGSDLLGETWRSLGGQLNMVQILSELPSDKMIPKEVTIGIMNDLPKTMQFTSINGFFQRFVPGKDKFSSALFFIAGYFLQALIAVSWELCSELGVTFKSVILSWQKFYSNHMIEVAIVFAVIIFFFYSVERCGHSVDGFFERHAGITSSVFNVFCVELLRAILLIGIFGLTLQVMEKVVSSLGINLTGWIVEVLKIFWFLLLNYWINKIADVLIEEFGFEKNSFGQDVFCAVISAIVLAVCLGVYFVA